MATSIVSPTTNDLLDKLSARLVQLSALLTRTYGEDREVFDRYVESVRENYMWCCGTLADEAVELLIAAQEAHAREVQRGRGAR